MRPCDTSKQCLWMGTSQYRSGCRNAATNPNRCAQSCAKRDSLRGRNANTYSDPDCNTAADTYTYLNADGDTYANAFTDSDLNTDTYGDGHSYSSAQGNPKASADSASSAVRGSSDW